MRRRGYHGGGGGGNFGLMLLIFQLVGFVQFLSSHNEFIPATLAILAINVLAFIRPGLGGIHRLVRSFHWPSVHESCISARTVWFGGQWERILLGPFVHADSWHLYYNMISFMWKARTLEKRYGSFYFAYVIAVFTVLTSMVYLLFNVYLAEYVDWSYSNVCAVGFSGVIFAVKVLTTHLQPNHMSYVFGIGIPSKLAVWAELILISVLNPNASFIGHLAGILVGLAFVSGPLKMIMDIPWAIVTSGEYNDVIMLHCNAVGVNAGRQSYNYTARPSGIICAHAHTDTQ